MGMYELSTPWWVHNLFFVLYACKRESVRTMRRWLGVQGGHKEIDGEGFAATYEAPNRGRAGDGSGPTNAILQRLRQCSSAPVTVSSTSSPLLVSFS